MEVFQLALTSKSITKGFWRVVSLPDGGVGRTPPSSPELSLSLEDDESEEEALEVEPSLGREGGRGNSM